MDVEGYSDVVDVATNGNTCVIHGAPATLTCMGSNNVGELGTGDQVFQSEPIVVELDAAPVRVTIGSNSARHTCALLEGVVSGVGGATFRGSSAMA